MKTRMKKVIILVGLLLIMAHTAFAEQRGVFMDFHRKSNPEKNMEVNRAPMRLPIDVVYDPDTKCITVTGDESMNAEVFLYNESGEIEDYSSSLNAKLLVTTQGRHRIQIEGENWVAEGVIEI